MLWLLSRNTAQLFNKWNNYSFINLIHAFSRLWSNFSTKRTAGKFSDMEFFSCSIFSHIWTVYEKYGETETGKSPYLAIITECIFRLCFCYLQCLKKNVLRLLKEKSVVRILPIFYPCPHPFSKVFIIYENFRRKVFKLQQWCMFLSSICLGHLSTGISMAALTVVLVVIVFIILVFVGVAPRAYQKIKLRLKSKRFF